MVLTGTFPELVDAGSDEVPTGEAEALHAGKAQVKTWLEKHGGRVTGSISGKTSFVLLGDEPGASKVDDAERRKLPIVDLKTLREILAAENAQGGSRVMAKLRKTPAPQIETYSSGFDGSAAKRLAKMENNGGGKAPRVA